MNIRVLCFLAAAGLVPARAFASTAPAASPRVVLTWDAGWRFSMGEFASAMMPAFDDHGWRVVRLPHDWSTEEPLSPKFGSGNGYAAGGIGWYRKHFTADPAWRGRTVSIEFDGVYDHAEVWLNGQFLGGRPYGYSSFALDLTPYLEFGSAGNVLAVRVDHSRFADSRWYTGSGIDRHVRLAVTNPLQIAHWGTFVSTPAVAPEVATVRIETTVSNATARRQSFVVDAALLDADGRVVASAADANGMADAGATSAVVQTVALRHPRLWSPDSPVLYTLRCRLREGAAVVDETLTPFGVRSLRFDPNSGFALNGRPMKLKGVCLHGDGGPVGAAVPAAVWERRLETLKAIGVNAIRTAHNPPAPEFLDLCDHLGFLVMEEAFDEFTPTKKKWVAGWNHGVPSRFGYGEDFAEWGVRDIQTMVRRDRNHPSVILWSIGNEIDYPNDPFSSPVLGKDYRPANPPAQNLVTLARPLIAAVKALDDTRPVTAALASIRMSESVGLPEMLDVVGYNYQEADYAADHAKHPRRFIFGSENLHTYAAWEAVRDHAYVGGQFLWTGVDYLGEAGRWPNHAAGFGLLDLCGFRKPQSWFRQSLWSERPMVYLCVPGRGADEPAAAHWNWTAGSTVTVACYTNCPEVKLTLNGRSLGIQPRSAAVNGVLTWRVPYQSGVIEAFGREHGHTVCSFELRTAGEAKRIELLADTRRLAVDGGAVSQIEFRLVDAHGVRVEDADREVTFSVSGPAVMLGMGSGDRDDTESCRGSSRRTWRGRGLAIIRRTEDSGDITVRATAPGLSPAVLVLHAGGASMGTGRSM